jgi:hypothetical protein
MGGSTDFHICSLSHNRSDVNILFIFNEMTDRIPVFAIGTRRAFAIPTNTFVPPELRLAEYWNPQGDLSYPP